MTTSPGHESKHSHDDDDSHIPVVGDMRDELDPDDRKTSLRAHKHSHHDDDSHIPVAGDMRDELDPGTDRT